MRMIGLLMVMLSSAWWQPNTSTMAMPDQEVNKRECGNCGGREILSCILHPHTHHVCTRPDHEGPRLCGCVCIILAGKGQHESIRPHKSITNTALMHSDRVDTAICLCVCVCVYVCVRVCVYVCICGVGVVMVAIAVV
jgi:hypothetical protein